MVKPGGFWKRVGRNALVTTAIGFLGIQIGKADMQNKIHRAEYRQHAVEQVAQNHIELNKERKNITEERKQLQQQLSSADVAHKDKLIIQINKMKNEEMNYILRSWTVQGPQTQRDVFYKIFGRNARFNQTFSFFIREELSQNPALRDRFIENPASTYPELKKQLSLRGLEI